METTLGERIKKARESNGYLQSQLAEMIGVKSGAVISNWEKGINKPDAEKIVKLCGALGVSASYLLDFYGKEDKALTLKEFEMVKNFRKLGDEGKEHVETFIRWEIDALKKREAQDGRDET